MFNSAVHPAARFGFITCIGGNNIDDDIDLAIGVTFMLSSVPVAHGAWVVEDGTISYDDPFKTSSTGLYGYAHC